MAHETLWADLNPQVDRSENPTTVLTLASGNVMKGSQGMPCER